MIFKKLLLITTSALCLAFIAPSFADLPTTLKRGNGMEPTSLDPSLANGVPDFNVLSDLFEGLSTYDKDGKLTHGAAEKWEVSADGKTYTFTLRKDLKWSNGEPITAHDFEYGWKRSVDPKTTSTYTFLMEPVVGVKKIIDGTSKDSSSLGVKATDDHTFVVNLHNPTPYFTGLVAHPFFGPQHKASIEKHGKQFTKPGNLVSSGAYMLETWTPQEKIRLVKNPHYYNAASVQIPAVEFYPLERQTEEFNRFQADGLHMTYEFPAELMEKVQSDPILKTELKITPYLTNYYYGFNLTKPPFKDQPKLRKALSMVIHREAITKNITKGGEIPLYGWVPHGVDNYWDRQKVDFVDKTYGERVAEAKKLYAEAGYSESNPLTVEILYNTNEEHKKIAIQVANMWQKALGVKTQLKNSEFKVFLSDRTKFNTQVFRGGWAGDYNDPYTFFELMISGGGINNVGYANSEYDALVKKASETIDLKERSQVLSKAERIFLDDHAIAPVYTHVRKRMVSRKIAGYISNVQDVVLTRFLSFKE